jgi:ABC-type transport system substrate-binding protein
MAQAIQADLAAVGVQASIQTFEWGAYLNKYGKGFGQEADMGAMSFMLDPGDPAPMLSLVIDGLGVYESSFAIASGCTCHPAKPATPMNTPSAVGIIAT